ncbi:MAG: hypothetical protein NVSMB33_06860 [Ktedonobacteraceae bacterium]
MKRVVFLSLVCVTILLVTAIYSFLVSPYAQAGRGIQMLSGTFNDQNLPGDNQTKITLVSIPFSVSATTSKLEATSLINATDPLQSTGGGVLCELDVDNISFFTDQTYLPPYVQGDSVSVGVTSATTGIAAGSHTFTVKCVGSSGYNGPSIPVHSLGTSVIITG